jgi:dsDNA-binding SOS-regulon protein
LSTLFAFRAAAFGELPMITNVSFASPYCGDQGFRDHFYELEKSKRIRHLRVSNDEDIVTLLPNITLPIPNEFYKHTGMNIRLYNDEDQFLMPKCRLFYPKKGSLLNEVRNAVLSNVVTGLSVGVLSKHLCPEYSKRLDDAEEELQKITLEGLYSDPDITGWSYRDFELSPDLAIEDIMKPVEEVNPIEKTKASDDHTKTNLDAHWVKAPEVLGQVHCITIMKDGTILGIGMNHKLYTRTNLGASWVMAPDLGQVKGVTIMTDGTILGIGMSGKLYTRANLNSRWVKAPDFGKVKVITIMKDGTILGVGMNDKFYTRDDLTVNWAKAPDVGGQVKGVAIMGDGTILGVGMNGKLSTRANLNVKWVMAPDVGQRKVKAITIMEDGTILGVGINNKLYIRSLETALEERKTNTNLDAYWVKAPEVLGQVHCITMMKDGTILGIGMNHKLYTRTNLDDNWVMAPDYGQVKGVTIMTDGIILGIGMSGKLYTRANLNSRWVKAFDHGKVKAITVMKDGTILGVDMNGKIHTRANLGTKWVKTPEVGGQVKGVAIMGDGTILGVGMNGKLYMRANLGAGWVMAPDVGQRQVKAITIMEDGTILGVGINNKLFIRSLDVVRAVSVPPKKLVFLSEEEFALPATISFDATMGGNADLILPWFSSNKKPWGDKDCDALTWFLAANRDDFTFRFRGYHFDHKAKQLSKLRSIPGKSNRIVCTITSTSAEYYIDGTEYATVEYPLGTLGSTGHFGIHTAWNQQALRVSNLEIDGAVSVPPKKLVFLSEEEFALPATISFDATMYGDGDPVIPWFSSNKKPWGDKDCDALTWFLAANRDDFTFRFRGYQGDGHNVTQLSKLRSIPGKSNRIVCTITSTSAEYYIDGTEYATVEYPLGTLGPTGHFGIHTAWNQQALRVSNLEIDGE